MSARVLRRYLVAGAAGAAVLLALPTAAGAHVEAEGETAEGVTTVAFSFHHGCDGAATTGLRIQLPEGATEVAAEDPAGWTSTVSGGELAWTGGSVPDSQEATFVATMTLADPEGTTVYLPTIQECGAAQEAWIDKSEDPEANNAAPRITAGPVTAGDPADVEESEGSRGSAPATEPEKTTNEGVGGAPAPTTAAPAESNQAAPATEDASSTSTSRMPLLLGIIAAIVVIGVVLWFVVARRGSTPTPPST